MQKWASHKSGFTIVELLIVVVVIAILAAITIVAYNGVTQRATAAAASSAAEQAAKKVLIYTTTNSDQTPPNLAAAGVTNQGSTSYQYSNNTTVSPQTFCITATTNTTSYFVNNTNQSTPTAGACPGHGANGATPITNLAANPEAANLVISANQLGWGTSRWFGFSPAAGTYSWVTGASDGPQGIASYLRKTWTTAPSSFAQTGDTGFDNSNGGTSAFAVSNGQTLTISCYVRPSVTRNFGIGIQPYDSSGNALTRVPETSTLGNANQWTRVSLTWSVPTGVSYIYSTCDSNADGSNGAQNWPVNGTLDGTALMVTQGATLYKYADPIINSSSWVWNGATNASSSTGSPL